MSQPPTGTVTFLFTDIQGSTRLWEQHPDQIRLALARHDAILNYGFDGDTCLEALHWVPPPTAISEDLSASSARFASASPAEFFRT